MSDFSTFNDRTESESVSDVLDSGLSEHGTLTVGTSPVEVKVGANRKTLRKLVTLDNTSNVVIYWGYDNTVSTTSYAGRIFKDAFARWSVGENQAIFVIAGTAGNIVRISEGA